MESVYLSGRYFGKTTSPIPSLGEFRDRRRDSVIKNQKRCYVRVRDGLQRRKDTTQRHERTSPSAVSFAPQIRTKSAVRRGEAGPAFRLQALLDGMRHPQSHGAATSWSAHQPGVHSSTFSHAHGLDIYEQVSRGQVFMRWRPDLKGWWSSSATPREIAGLGSCTYSRSWSRGSLMVEGITFALA